jgi:hypothetical protein
MAAYCIMPAYCDGLYRRDESIISPTTEQLFSKMPNIVAPLLLVAPRRQALRDQTNEEECQWFSPASVQFDMLC